MNLPQQERRPGIPCPECNFFIEMPIADLLYNPSFTCPSCGLTLSMDRGQSKTSLEALQQLHVALKNAETLKQQAQNPSTMPRQDGK